MAMPQVHIVAYCVDLGYGGARGAEMLAIMSVGGVVSRIASGWIADRVGGIRTLLLGSTLQAMVLLFYLVFDGLVSLYLVSALFGLVQGGIIPSYGMIVREYFPPREAGMRIGIAISGPDCSGTDELLRCADAAMYRAKRAKDVGWAVHNGTVPA